MELNASPSDKTKFAAQHLVLRQGVAVHIDPLDIDARRFFQREGNVHLQRILVAPELRFDIGKGIAERARQFGQLFDRVLDQLGIIRIAGLHRQVGRHALVAEIAQLAFHADFAEAVLLPFLDHISNDEIALVGCQFGHGGDHAEIGIALRQVELAQLLLVESKPVGVIAGVGAEKAGQTRLLGHHLAAQLAIRKDFVADDVDLTNLGFRPFGNLVHDIDTILAELHGLGFDRSGEAPLSLVQFDDTLRIGAHLGPGVYLARGKFDFGRNLVGFQPIVAFQNDPVDDRIFDHLDHHVAAIVAHGGTGEQFGRVQILDRLVSGGLCVGFAGRQADIADDGLRFEPLGTDHRQRADRLRLRDQRGGFGRSILRSRVRNRCAVLRKGSDRHACQHRSAQQCRSKTGAKRHVRVA